MAFRVMRQKREQRRNAKLNEIFDDKDPHETGYITIENVIDIFRVYQVNLDIENAKNMADEDGNMTRENFMLLGTKTKLVDLAGKEQTPEQTPTKHPHPHHNYYSKKSSGGFLCCCKNSTTVIPDEDRVELAFRRIDLNNDGFITWDEFVKNVGDVDPVQAKRIFQTCDNDGDQKITLIEFKAMANSM